MLTDLLPSVSLVFINNIISIFSCFLFVHRVITVKVHRPEMCVHDYDKNDRFATFVRVEVL